MWVKNPIDVSEIIHMSKSLNGRCLIFSLWNHWLGFKTWSVLITQSSLPSTCPAQVSTIQSSVLVIAKSICLPMHRHIHTDTMIHRQFPCYNHCPFSASVFYLLGGPPACFGDKQLCLMSVMQNKYSCNYPCPLALNRFFTFALQLGNPVAAKPQKYINTEKYRLFLCAAAKVLGWGEGRAPTESWPIASKCLLCDHCCLLEPFQVEWSSAVFYCGMAQSCKHQIIQSNTAIKKIIEPSRQLQDII